MEALVRRIVLQVMREMAEQGVLPPVRNRASSPLPEKQDRSVFFSGRVLSRQALEEDLGWELERLTVAPGTLVTPLVRDLLRDRGIELLFEAELEESGGDDGHEVSSRRQVVVCCARPGGSKEKRILETLRAAGRQPRRWREEEEGRPHGGFAAVLEIGRRVAEGEFQCGIALTDGVFPVWKQLKRIEGVRPLIGWDAAAINTDGRAANSNFLLLSSTQLGLSMLEKAVASWLSALSRGEERG